MRQSLQLFQHRTFWSGERSFCIVLPGHLFHMVSRMFSSHAIFSTRKRNVRTTGNGLKRAFHDSRPRVVSSTCPDPAFFHDSTWQNSWQVVLIVYWLMKPALKLLRDEIGDYKATVYEKLENLPISLSKELLDSFSINGAVPLAEAN